MLLVSEERDRVHIENGYGPGILTVTRFRGERWPQVGADLLCGVADVFPDVGIITVGKSSSFSEVQLHSPPRIDGIEHATWLQIQEADTTSTPVYAWSDELGWVFVPSCRENVIELIEWTMWHPGDEEGGFRTVAFSGSSDFRRALGSENWNGRSASLTRLIEERCLSNRLFEFGSGWGEWNVFAGALDLDHLFRLTNAVAARISTSLSD